MILYFCKENATKFFRKRRHWCSSRWRHGLPLPVPIAREALMALAVAALAEGGRARRAASSSLAAAFIRRSVRIDSERSRSVCQENCRFFRNHGVELERAALSRSASPATGAMVKTQSARTGSTLCRRSPGDDPSGTAHRVGAKSQSRLRSRIVRGHAGVAPILDPPQWVSLSFRFGREAADGRTAGTARIADVPRPPRRLGVGPVACKQARS